MHGSQPSWRVVCLAVALLSNLIGCTGPTTGVTVYEEPQFKGDSRTFDHSVSDLIHEQRGSKEDDHWDKCISSIRVDVGWSVVLFSDDDFAGECLRVGPGESIPYLGDVKSRPVCLRPGDRCGDDWNDCVSSMSITEIREW